MRVIFTTENPRYKNVLNFDNQDIMRMLNHLGERPDLVEGCYNGKKETSILVDLKQDTFDIIKTLAKLSGQESIFLQQYGINYIIFVNGPNKGKACDGQGERVSEEPFDDNYTKIGGLYRKFEVDFSDLYWWE